MKRVLLTLFAAATAVACSNSEEIEASSQEYGVGRISLGVSASNAIEIIDSSESRATTSTVEIPAEFIPEADDFSLVITGTYYDPSSETYMDFYEEYESLSAYNNMEIDTDDPSQYNPPYLVAGTYTAVMEYGEGVDVESATNAHFKGTLEFEIVARDVDGVATITATLQNSMIKLTTTEYFKKYFEGGATLTLSTTQQSKIIVDTMDAESEEQFLFVSPETTLYLEGEGVKQDPGNGSAPTVTFSKSAIGTTTAQTLSTVVVDADDAGGAAIEITMDDNYTEINEIDVDLHF